MIPTANDSTTTIQTTTSAPNPTVTPVAHSSVGIPTRSLLSDLDKLIHTNPIIATAEWLKCQSSNSTPTHQAPAHGTSSSTVATITRDIPVPGDFLVPTNLIEHNLIVARLVSAGSLTAEAEQTIASRKAAYNKALHEYKKENPSNQSSGRPTRQSKLSKNNSSQNAN